MLIPTVNPIPFTTTEELKATKLNLVLCEEPYSSDAIGFETKLANAGYAFNVIRFKSIEHFAERYLMMDDTEKDNIHIFYTHHHDGESDEEIVDSVAEEMKRRQTLSNENISILIAGININYDDIPVFYINDRKETLAKYFDITVHNEQFFEPNYWLTNSVNSYFRETFFTALFYTLFENLHCRRSGRNSHHFNHDLIDRY